MANAKNITKVIVGEELYYFKDKQVRDSIGANNGIATLDSTGHISNSQIPSSVTNVLSDWNEQDNSSAAYILNKPTIPTVPTNVSAFNNDAGYLTQHQDISGKADQEDLEQLIDDISVIEETSGLTVKTLGTTATAEEKAAWNAKVDTSDLATVATSGSYNDLSNLPTIVNTVAGKSGTVILDKTDVGLGNVTNDSQVKRSEMGVANGVATLDENGKVPSTQLPSYVDDVIDLLSVTTAPSTFAKGDKYYNSTSKKIYTATSQNAWDNGEDPESGKIYINVADSKTYRWSGSAMAEISESLAIGTVQGTAYDGAAGDSLNTRVGTIETNLDGVKLKKITQNDYDALVQAGTTDANTLYIIRE